MRFASLLTLAVAAVAGGIHAQPKLPQDSQTPSRLPAAAGQAANVKPGVSLPDNRIAGVIRLQHCNAPAETIRVTVSGAGKRINVPLVANPADQFSWRYEAAGLAPGTYTVTPQLPTHLCPGGSWTPENASVALTAPAGQTVQQDFTYRVAALTRRVPLVLLAGGVYAAFDGTQIRLNNYTPHRYERRRGGGGTYGSWYKADDAWIQLGPNLGGRRLMLDIPEVHAGWGRRYYLADVNLRRIDVQAVRFDGAVASALGAERGIRIAFLFEDQGLPEIKGRCSEHVTCFNLGSGRAGSSDTTAPDFHIDGLRLDLFVVPGRFGPDLSYDRVLAKVSHTRFDGPGGFFELLDELLNLLRAAETEISRRLTTALNDPQLRSAVARNLRPVLDREGIGPIIAHRLVGDALEIEYLPKR
ncbi:MAG: hypothetical protein N2483_00480 [Burkholderiaceae bacterium]|nr:hypothetical protein [Burkholderiaceae bacterium]